MPSSDSQNGSPFSYVCLEERIPARHQLPKIKSVVAAALISTRIRQVSALQFATTNSG